MTGVLPKGIAIGTVMKGKTCTDCPSCIQDPLVGPIVVAGWCAAFNCFDGASIEGHDMTCESQSSQENCANKCCSQGSCCKGFDYNPSDDRCCTSTKSRADFNGQYPFEKNWGDYMSCDREPILTGTNETIVCGGPKSTTLSLLSFFVALFGGSLSVS
eukprot:gnl/TRDRNA2_/TRDRNA2_63816_c0_seq1.p1 gnl/TRDRNA2_/TRDRNA2_63816_c0~~gnl/TRDRNA2_/TRDRNA2_63816_c0_seq1.p1  ORF type:complete len:158 (+),score=15.38 gnl/TRDRNA2_/TRDRNA2_63816_c0_seq1:126-599(+)